MNTGADSRFTESSPRHRPVLTARRMRHAVMRLSSSIPKLSIALLVGGLSCTSSNPTVVRSGPPYTEGTITAIDSTRGYLVAGRAASSAPPQAYVHRTNSTDVSWDDGRRASSADLVIGRFVEVWAATI